MRASLATAVDVVVSPDEAFRRLHERPTCLVPLLVLIVLTGAVVFWYYQLVDLPWLVESQMPESAPQGQPLTALERPGAATVLGGLAALAGGAGLAIGLLVLAGYLAFVSMLTNDGGTFRRWFSLVCWSCLPMAFTQLATGVNLLVNDVARMPPTELNPLAFMNLLGIEAELAGVQAFAANLDPITIWATILIVLGYHAWSQRPIWKAAAVVLGPFAVIAALVLVL